MTEDYETAEENRRQARLEKLNVSLHDYISDIQKAKEELNSFKEQYLMKPFYKPILENVQSASAVAKAATKLKPNPGRLVQLLKQRTGDISEELKDALGSNNQRDVVGPREAKTAIPESTKSSDQARLTPIVIRTRGMKSTKHVRSFVHPPAQYATILILP